jgi:hypothetical protein
MNNPRSHDDEMAAMLASLSKSNLWKDDYLPHYEEKKE